MNRKSTAVDTAAEAVREARGKLVEWEATKAAAESELARLDSIAGDQVLDDPDAAEDLPRLMQEQRDRAEVAGRAIEAQRARVRAAERGYLSAEAAVLERPVAALRAALDRHNARTAELLKAVEEHEGRYVPERELLEEQWANGVFVGPKERLLARSEVLQAEIDAAELPVRILQVMANGQDPAAVVTEAGGVQGFDRPAAEIYPACVWGPDALVPAPAYLRSVEAVRAAEQSRQVSIDTARRRVDELENAIANGDSAEVKMQDWTLGIRKPLPEQLEQARRQLAELLDEPGIVKA